MDDLAIVEMTDAAERHQEGGGAMPSVVQMQQSYPYGLSNMGTEGTQGAWYKNPTWLALMGLGVAATAFVVYAATKKKD